MDIYLDGVAGGSRRPFSAGWLLFLEVGTTISGYLQQQIGDNQWDKICILGWKGRRAPDKGSISDTNIVDIYLDGVAGGSGRPFSAGLWEGLLVFLEAGTTFSGYLQQQIGDNQWDKKCIIGWKGRRTFEQEAGAEPGRLATGPTPLRESFI